MNPDRIRELYEATEHSWESTAAQWVTVFDAVTSTPDHNLSSIEEAVWNTYNQARQLRKLVSTLWLSAQNEALENMRREALPGIRTQSADESWIVD